MQVNMSAGWEIPLQEEEDYIQKAVCTSLN